MTVAGGKIELVPQEISNDAGMPAAGPQLKLSFEARDPFGGGI
jgi:hypothetical protein